MIMFYHTSRHTTIRLRYYYLNGTMPVHNDTELILMLIQIYPDVKRPAR